MNDHLGSEAATLSRIAERAMKERGLEPRVPEAALRAASELPDTLRTAGSWKVRGPSGTSIERPVTYEAVIPRRPRPPGE